MPLKFVENHEHLPVQKLANAFHLNPKRRKRSGNGLGNEGKLIFF